MPLTGRNLWQSTGADSQGQERGKKSQVVRCVLLFQELDPPS